MAASAGSTAARRPVPVATAPSRPIAPARSTLADGLATTTNPTIVAAAHSALDRTPTRVRRSAASTAPVMITTFPPLTAVRCVSPAARKSARRPGSSSLTSPSTSPGNRPRTGCGRTVAAARRSARSRPATRWYQTGPATSLDGPWTNSTAPISPPGSGGSSRASTATLVLGSSPRQPSPGARTRTGTSSRATRPPGAARAPTAGALEAVPARTPAPALAAVAPGPAARWLVASRTSRAGTATLPRSPATPAGPPPMGCGSSETTSSTPTVARAAASWASTPDRLSWPPTPATKIPTASPATTATATARHPR